MDNDGKRNLQHLLLDHVSRNRLLVTYNQVFLDDIVSHTCSRFESTREIEMISQDYKARPCEFEVGC